MENNSDLLDPKDVWNDLTNDQRIAATMIVFEKIREHIEKGGTYRYLIYNRLRFGYDAYVPLYSSGGLTISNFINTYNDYWNKGIYELEEK